MSDPKPRILLVEDEVDLAESVAENLVAEGYEVEVAHDGDRGLECALGSDHDLVLLDVMLPGRDGFEVCREIRASGRTVPVLFLTAKADPDDRIRGLEEGGDDYLTKPFHLRELLLRVSAILRRSRWFEGEREGSGIVAFAGNEVNLRTYTARSWDGQEHELTHKEAMILKLLAERAGEVVSRDDILDIVWGFDAFPTARTIDNFILRLRRRFEPEPQSPRHFHTVHGAGYRFTFEPQS
jgi:two-component system alkaline phosphatase synthesis response regulator PhoP